MNDGLRIEDILNKRFSTRNMSDEDFHENVDSLASQLKDVSYIDNYSEETLRKDWKNLCKYKIESNDIASTSRVGMKLCQHFFPNFYEISTPNKKSFSDLWQDVELLKKILVWNRKSHSTPYLSELKRGVYFCAGITKSTMYRPQMAKIVTHGKKTVFDPCAGWGGRMLGAVSNGCKYYAFEPNTKTYKNLNNLAAFLGIEDYVEIFNDDLMNIDKYDFPDCEILLTSPPYYNVEIYCQEETQSISKVKSYSDWVDKFLSPAIMKSVERLTDDGESCWNVAKIGKYDMWEDVFRTHQDIGFSFKEEYNVISSTRPTLNKTKKSFDRTVKFTKGN